MQKLEKKHLNINMFLAYMYMFHGLLFTSYTFRNRYNDIIDSDNSDNDII